jgi:uncharacterized membrane protein
MDDLSKPMSEEEFNKRLSFQRRKLLILLALFASLTLNIVFIAKFDSYIFDIYGSYYAWGLLMTMKTIIVFGFFCHLVMVFDHFHKTKSAKAHRKMGVSSAGLFKRFNSVIGSLENDRFFT